MINPVIKFLNESAILNERNAFSKILHDPKYAESKGIKTNDVGDAEVAKAKEENDKAKKAVIAKYREKHPNDTTSDEVLLSRYKDQIEDRVLPNPGLERDYKYEHKKFEKEDGSTPIVKDMKKAVTTPKASFGNQKHTTQITVSDPDFPSLKHKFSRTYDERVDNRDMIDPSTLDTNNNVIIPEKYKDNPKFDYDGYVESRVRKDIEDSVFSREPAPKSETSKKLEAKIAEYKSKKKDEE